MINDHVKMFTQEIPKNFLMKRKRRENACAKKELTFTTEAKSSSKIIISELSLATSVPWIPIARPISA